MTLNEFCLKNYSRHWVQLGEAYRKRAYTLHKFGSSIDFEDLLGEHFKTGR